MCSVIPGLERRGRQPAAPTVLLVEDNVLVRKALRLALARWDYLATVAGCCREARDQGLGFDIGLFDVELPDGDGVELAEEALLDGRVQRVVFYTAVPADQLPGHAARLGRIVSKSAGIEALRAALSDNETCPCPR